MIYSIQMVLYLLFNIIELTIFIECIASWVPQVQGNKFINLIHNFVYPILEPIRRLQDRLIPGLPMDFSPVIALLIINLLRGLI
ncbi:MULTISPECIES: YggT family protein [unclassified Clostridium]|uniref:YggT family protein n=1 Tax=unclassified Clostridium TaxID=2614128 RepID=UPI0002972B8B|nr:MULTISPECIES: YggT family protein [unclassified Clostridium]EKQ56890.1 MAG: YGGT family protein [Clostridium sp. Maddingley MBC34-26]